MLEDAHWCPSCGLLSRYLRIARTRPSQRTNRVCMAVGQSEERTQIGSLTCRRHRLRFFCACTPYIHVSGRVRGRWECGHAVHVGQGGSYVGERRGGRICHPAIFYVTVPRSDAAPTWWLGIGGARSVAQQQNTVRSHAHSQASCMRDM